MKQPSSKNKRAHYRLPYPQAEGPTVRIEDLFAAMRKDPDPAMRGHVERVGLSLAEESALESALGGTY